MALKRLRFSSVLSDEEVKDCIRELKILVYAAFQGVGSSGVACLCAVWVWPLILGSKAQHQNIVKFYGLVLNDRLSDLAYVMEFMERGSLQRVKAFLIVRIMFTCCTGTAERSSSILSSASSYRSGCGSWYGLFALSSTSHCTSRLEIIQLVGMFFFQL